MIAQILLEVREIKEIVKNFEGKSKEEIIQILKDLKEKQNAEERNWGSN